MITADVTIDLKSFEMAQRLQSHAASRGISNPRQLFEGMQAGNYDVSFGGIKTIWYGQSIPNLASASMICDFLGMSLDFYAWGKESQPAGFAEIEAWWRTMAAKWGYDNTRTLDVSRARIVELIQNMTDEQVKVFHALGEGLLSVKTKGVNP